ncbi:hypothetical protein S7711_08630 [Stachybotrys chartarum IBT 7711]|uniref:Velvet domain-containing protein n=1 Tax=Stachybotrys chartarum (strain CBS 109288 / IBT 7711) TaxID=1280523 RepID=A0A084BCL0_STACB|nr:hypothetical protein S7711_08630 [Stachybotrys chartarum IBT 7711]
MEIAKLIGPSEQGSTTVPHYTEESRAFQLKVRQEPQCARACSRPTPDRRPIQPWPIVELSCPSPSEGFKKYIMTCVICDEGGTDLRRCLVGTTTATPLIAEDQDGCRRCFFVFSDLSCCWKGSYKLEFRAIKIESGHKRASVLARTTSTSFQVVTAKDFIPVKCNELQEALIQQGYKR